ncbi:hypothetical protein TIFTF001_008417 [Ficus carica]|uniref:Uncharacterized protein n=1 Tax=Ficus carica TaxID=3494 RepID=A0AA88CXY3_FICCA|nr:hypothetical protein TIFTF001_008417 [Ficus carica]
MEMQDTTTNPKSHAIIVAFCLQGHAISTVHLSPSSHQEASPSPSSTLKRQTLITMLKQHDAKSEDQQSENIFVGEQNSSLDIRYIMVSDEFPIKFDRFANKEEYHEGQLNVLPNHVDKLVGDIVRDDPSVSFLIGDTFYIWTSQSAKKFKIVSVSFWTQWF